MVLRSPCQFTLAVGSQSGFPRASSLREWGRSHHNFQQVREVRLHLRTSMASPSFSFSAGAGHPHLGPTSYLWLSAWIPVSRRPSFGVLRLDVDMLILTINPPQRTAMNFLELAKPGLYFLLHLSQMLRRSPGDGAIVSVVWVPKLCDC